MNPEQNESQREFEKYWNDTHEFKMSEKDRLKHCWQACEKRLLLSRVQLPERRIKNTEWGHEHQNTCCDCFNDCLDQIKLVPLTIEQLLPSDEQIEIASIKDSASLRYDNKEKYCTNKDFVEARSKAFIRGANYVRDCIYFSHRAYWNKKQDDIFNEQIKDLLRDVKSKPAPDGKDG